LWASYAQHLPDGEPPLIYMAIYGRIWLYICLYAPKICILGVWACIFQIARFARLLLGGQSKTLHSYLSKACPAWTSILRTAEQRESERGSGLHLSYTPRGWLVGSIYIYSAQPMLIRVSGCHLNSNNPTLKGGESTFCYINGHPRQYILVTPFFTTGFILDF